MAVHLHTPRRRRAAAASSCLRRRRCAEKAKRAANDKRRAEIRAANEAARAAQEEANPAPPEGQGVRRVVRQPCSRPFRPRRLRVCRAVRCVWSFRRPPSREKRNVPFRFSQSSADISKRAVCRCELGAADAARSETMASLIASVLVRCTKARATSRPHQWQSTAGPIRHQPTARVASRIPSGRRAPVVPALLPPPTALPHPPGCVSRRHWSWCYPRPQLLLRQLLVMAAGAASSTAAAQLLMVGLSDAMRVLYYALAGLPGLTYCAVHARHQHWWRAPRGTPRARTRASRNGPSLNAAGWLAGGALFDDFHRLHSMHVASSSSSHHHRAFSPIYPCMDLPACARARCMLDSTAYTAYSYRHEGRVASLLYIRGNLGLGLL